MSFLKKNGLVMDESELLRDLNPRYLNSKNRRVNQEHFFIDIVSLLFVDALNSVQQPLVVVSTSSATKFSAKVRFSMLVNLFPPFPQKKLQSK